jgi:poly(3-hydroxybutyrate) depolymerase
MNRYSFLVAALIFGLSAGGLTQVSGFGGKPTDSFKVAGVMRYYSLHAPSGLGSNPPLVFNVHGYNIDGPLMQAITQMDKVADRDKFIIVYPSALNKSWNMTTGGDDLTFIVAIIDTIDARYHINRNRVYVTGFSQGGFISFLLGCKYSDVFAAIAPVSGLLPSGTCTLKRPVPMFLKFGTNDVATPASFMSSVNSWLKLDSCPSTPVVTRPYPSTNPKSKVTRLYYGPCAQGSEVVVDTVAGGTHEWVLTADTNVNTSEETWAFLKNFSLKGNSSAKGRQLFSTARDAITASYRTGVVRLQGIREKCMVRVIDTKGRPVGRATAVKNQFPFFDKPSGMYIVNVDTKTGPVAIRIVVP